jgi:hypothetical protein
MNPDDWALPPEGTPPEIVAVTRYRVAVVEDDRLFDADTGRELTWWDYRAIDALA